MLKDFRFHHIGIAVFNIEDSASIYTNAGYEKTIPVFDPIQNVYICFLEKEGMPRIALLAPHDHTSPIYNILQKNGPIPYHCCYEVDCIESAVVELRAQKFVPTSKAVSAVAFGGRKVCFLFNKNVGLIELLET